MSYNVRQTLDKRFIETEHVANIIDLSLTSGKNCIMHGPAGHGKSEMVMEAINGANLARDCFVQSFGEGMDETRLFGGLNFRRLFAKKPDTLKLPQPVICNS